MKRVVALLLFLVFTGVALAQTLVPPFPNSPTANQEVIGPDGQIYVWDGTKWVHGGAAAGPWAPETNPTGGTNNYAPLASPNFTGTLSLNGTAVTGLFAPLTNPANGQNNYAPLANPAFTGAVTIGGTAITGLFAPLTNPANGQNNYAPLANPTFTGTVNLANLTGTTTGTWTFPDGSTYTSLGHSNMRALGVGAGVYPGLLGLFQANGNLGAVIQVQNTGTGPVASEYLSLYNNLDNYGNLQLTNTGFTAGGAGVLPDTMLLTTDTTNGIQFISYRTSGKVQITLDQQAGGLDIGSITTTAWNLNRTLMLNNASITSNAAPWGGIPNINSSGTWLALPNGGSTSLTKHSGLVIVTEAMFLGTTCIYALGGGIAFYVGGSNPAACSTTTNCVVEAGRFGMCFWGGTDYMLINQTGNNTQFNVTMIANRLAP